MSLFENGGSQRKCFELTYQCVQTIRSTSLEAEQAFSAAGVNDSSLNMVCFLRSHF